MANNKCTIFYSWQSDRKESRNFISDCLSRIEKRTREFVLCEINRDTQGLAGAPDIGDSIYEKIDSADIFVADVTIINPDSAGRKTPNPNVLIELGYAIKSLGWDRIVLLYDKDFGEIEELPFDINHRRISAFSLKDSEEKTKTREYVMSCILSTIQILNGEHRLYGGNADTVKAQAALAGLISSGLKKVWNAYVQKCREDGMDLYDKIPPISEAQLALVEKVHDLLDEKQYELANIILFHMKMSRLGNDEMNGWEFADQLVPECFEPLGIEFAGSICELPVEQVVNKAVIDLLNALTYEKHIDYEEKRLRDGKVVFSTAKDDLYVCDRTGNIICKGKMEPDGFTGYKVTHDYAGEYLRGKRHGMGKEFGFSFYDVDSHFLVREGVWENDEFVKGKIYDVLVEVENGLMQYVRGMSGDIITKKDPEYRYQVESEDADYRYADLYLENGNYSIIEGSVKALAEG